MYVITREDDDGEQFDTAYHTVEDAIEAAKEHADAIEPYMLFDVIETDDGVTVVAYTEDQTGEYYEGDYTEVYLISEA